MSSNIIQKNYNTQGDIIDIDQNYALAIGFVEEQVYEILHSFDSKNHPKFTDSDGKNKSRPLTLKETIGITSANPHIPNALNTCTGIHSDSGKALLIESAPELFHARTLDEQINGISHRYDSGKGIVLPENIETDQDTYKNAQLILGQDAPINSLHTNKSRPNIYVHDGKIINNSTSYSGKFNNFDLTPDPKYKGRLDPVLLTTNNNFKIDRDGGLCSYLLIK